MFVTIDDSEVANLRRICDEIFGEENFVTSIAWQKKVSPANDATWFSSDHDHILVYAKNKIAWRPNRLPMNDRQKGYYTNPDNDLRGPWNSATYTCNKNKNERPNLYYPLTNPNTGAEVWPKESAVWAYSKEKSKLHADEGLVYWGKDGNSNSPRLKNFLTKAKGVVPRTVWLYSDVGHTQEATKVLVELIKDIKFETPKPPRLIKHMLKIVTNESEHDLVLDFFSGSCSTAHAAMELNAVLGANNRYIMVQLPEPVDHANYKTIAEIGKERIRRVAIKIKKENPNYTGDLGFKVFKLDSSNIRAWNPDRNDMEQTLLDHTEHLVPGRSEEDVLYELLLKRGVDLTVPIEEKTITGKTVYSIGCGVLFACLDTSISRNEVEELARGIIAWRDECDLDEDAKSKTQVVFRDSAFDDDIAKTNMTAILEQNGIKHVRSL